MTKDDDAFCFYCYQAAADATFEAVVQELIDEANVTGGFVAMFGPPEMFEGFEVGGDGESSTPGARGPSVLPGRMWSPKP